MPVWEGTHHPSSESHMIILFIPLSSGEKNFYCDVRQNHDNWRTLCSFLVRIQLTHHTGGRSWGKCLSFFLCTPPCMKHTDTMRACSDSRRCNDNGSNALYMYQDQSYASPVEIQTGKTTMVTHRFWIFFYLLEADCVRCSDDSEGA